MNKGYKQWLVNDTDGALIFSMPNTGDPYGWYTGYKTYAFWASGIDTHSGHIASWLDGDLFLDESEADEFLAQKPIN